MEQNQQQPPVIEQPQNWQPQYQPYPQARPTLGFGEANRIFWRKSFDFSGRARRSEYWWGYLSVSLISLIWALVVAFIMALMIKNSGVYMLGDEEIFRWFFPRYLLIFSPVLLLMVPLYAAMTRRLHDTGHSGWWLVVLLVCSLIYMLGTFYLVFNATDVIDGGLPVALLVVLLVSYLIAIVLGITAFVLCLLDGKPGENKYGPSPKYQ